MKRRITATETNKPLIKQLPPPKFRKVPCCEMLIRGTSTAYSKGGSPRELWGIPPQEKRGDIRRELPVYYIAPMEENNAAWNRRFEATMHAAVERALNHSGKTLLGNCLREPTFLPVLIIGVVTHPLLKVKLGEHSPPAYRKNLELALVNGVPARTFPESWLDSRHLNDIDGYGNCTVHTMRIELTTPEYLAILANANELTNLFGLNMQRDFEARNQYISDVIKEKEVLYLAGKITEDEFEGAVEGVNSWYKHSRESIQPIFGYELPRTLRETGKHAYEGYTYIIGELVKHAMLPKAYSAIKEKLKELGLLQSPA